MFSKTDREEIALIALEVLQQAGFSSGQQIAQGVDQSRQQAGQTSLAVSEKLARVDDKLNQIASDTDRQRDKTSDAYTSRTKNIQDPGADEALEANVAFDQANFARNKKFDGDLFVSMNNYHTWLTMRQEQVLFDQRVRQQEELFHVRNMINTKVLDVQDSAVPAKS